VVPLRLGNWQFNPSEGLLLNSPGVVYWCSSRAATWTNAQEGTPRSRTPASKASAALGREMTEAEINQVAKRTDHDSIEVAEFESHARSRNGSARTPGVLS